MRILLAFIRCCMTLVSIGQDAQKSLRVQITYEKAGQYLEQAVVSIEAANVVGTATVVEYRAGRSVMMLPGFEAQTGSMFIANIKPVDLGKEGDKRLQLTAYPNPFENTTTISYYLPSDGRVNLWVTNAQGKTVGKLVHNENQTAGNHLVEWIPQSISSGIYIPIIETNQQKATARLVKK